MSGGDADGRQTGAGAPASASDVKKKLRAFIVDNFILDGALAQFRDGDSFLDHHILDSTGFLELISHLEESFGIEVADEEMIPENLDSLDGLGVYVLRKLDSRGIC